MAIDHERFARLVELTRSAWPEDHVVLHMDQGGVHLAAGRTHIMLAHRDVDLFEAALLVLSKKSLAQLTTGEVERLRTKLDHLARLWSSRGADIVASGRAIEDPFVVGEGTGIQRCAKTLHDAIA